MGQNRYLLYELFNKSITFVYHGRRHKGYAEDVYRDPIGKKIELVLKSHKDTLVFSEPTYIKKISDGIVFVYGVDEALDDDELFNAANESGESVNDILKDNMISTREIVFNFLD